MTCYGEPSLTYNRGKETVKNLAEHHAKVYLAARSQEKADAAIAEIQERVPGADINFLKLDMMDLAGVSASAKEFLRYSNIPRAIAYCLPLKH